MKILSKYISTGSLVLARTGGQSTDWLSERLKLD